jgi:hypothetical protein
MKNIQSIDSYICKKYIYKEIRYAAVGIIAD